MGGKPLEENIPDMEISSLFFIYCSAYMLLGFHTSVNSTLKQFSPTQNDESEAVRTIRIVCELCGPWDDERNGRREDWLCNTGLQGKVSSIPSYPGNRFNNLLAGAVGVISHIDDIQTFINDYVENPNAKSEVSYMTCKTIV